MYLTQIATVEKAYEVIPVS